MPPASFHKIPSGQEVRVSIASHINLLFSANDSYSNVILLKPPKGRRSLEFLFFTNVLPINPFIFSFFSLITSRRGGNFSDQTEKAKSVKPFADRQVEVTRETIFLLFSPFPLALFILTNLRIHRPLPCSQRYIAVLWNFTINGIKFHFAEFIRTTGCGVY